MRGGWQLLNAAPVNDTSMDAPKNMSSQQGQEYNALHEGQHGGGSLQGAPAFESQTLPSSMVEAARTGGTLQAFDAIRGMQDGGRRRGKKSRAKKSRAKKSRKSRKSRGRRRQGGGANMNPADAAAPGMLLSGRSASAAEGAMNPEWALAKNPTSFAPNA
jgi:hypothetical protein